MNFVTFLDHLTPIKIIVTLFALFAWSRVLLNFRAKHMNIKELGFWTIVWVLAIVVVFIPKKSDALARLLGIGRGFDAMVFIAITTLFYIVYRLYVKANENEEIITELVRRLALGNVKRGLRK